MDCTGGGCTGNIDGGNPWACGTGTAPAPSGGGGGCGFLGLGCVAHVASSVAGGALNGVTDALAHPVRYFETSLVSAMPTGMTSSGQVLFGNNASIDDAAPPWAIGDPNSIAYKASYWVAPMVLPGGGEDEAAFGAERGGGWLARILAPKIVAHAHADPGSGPTLFRGTTEGYAGSAGTQRAGITPASTDPKVATAFATHAEQFGRGAVQVATPGDLAEHCP